MGSTHGIRGHVFGARTNLGEVNSDAIESASPTVAPHGHITRTAFIELTEEGLIQSFNAGAEMAFGRRISEARGASITSLFPSERSDEPKWLLFRSSQGVQVIEHQTVMQGESSRRIEVSLSMFPTASRRLMMIVEERASWRELESSISMLTKLNREICDASDRGIAVATPEGKHVLSNANARELFGSVNAEFDFSFSAVELIDELGNQILEPQGLIGSLLAQGVEIDRTFEVRSAGRTDQRFVRGQGKVLLANGGEIKYLIYKFDDVTSELGSPEARVIRERRRKLMAIRFAVTELPSQPTD